MKKNILEFVRRGMSACGLGPIVLGIIYLILYHQGLVQTLSVSQVCIGIFSLSALAFVAGGMNFLYQIERLPLMGAILIHGGVLYLSYLVNDWLERGLTPILVFSGIFALGFLMIWAIIYAIIRRNTEKINEVLKEKQQNKETKV